MADRSELFCIRVIQSRKKLGMTQEQLAKAVGVKRPTINGWENPDKEKKYPNALNIERLAEALKVDPSWLRFGGKKNKYIQPLDDISDDDIDISMHPSQILSMEKIGEWLKKHKSILTKGVYMTESEKQKLTFRIRIENDAMVSKDNLAKSLLVGDVVKVNAAFDKLKSGDIVCARFGKDSNSYKFRQYNRDGAEEVLSALNEKYKNVIVDDKVSIVGVVTRVLRNI